MWIRTQRNVLLNLNLMEMVGIDGCEVSDEFQLTGWWYQFKDEWERIQIATYPTREAAEDAMEDLFEWLDTGQAIPPTVVDTSTVPINHRVYDFKE